MKEKLRKMIRKTMAMFMVVCVTVVGFSGITTKAAVNKALSVSYSFNGQSYEKDGEKCGFNNNYTIGMPGTSKKVALSKLKMSCDIYVPKKALKKKQAVVNVNVFLDLLDGKGEYIAGLPGRIFITAVNENGKIQLYNWDEVKEKAVKASKYVTCKAGTGKYKSFYVISLKNLAFSNKMYKEVDGKEVTVGVKSNTKYAFNVGINVCGENNKGSGKLYIDNVKVVSGSKKITNIDFSKKVDYWGSVKEKDITKKKMAIVKF